MTAELVKKEPVDQRGRRHAHVFVDDERGFLGSAVGHNLHGPQCRLPWHRDFRASPADPSPPCEGEGHAAHRRPRRALALGSRDATFRYHAGMAARAAGHKALARAYLSEAIARNPRFSALEGLR